jgi:hypothetical protein
LVKSATGAASRQVSLGWSDDRFVQITGGLHTGDVVLLPDPTAP